MERLYELLHETSRATGPGGYPEDGPQFLDDRRNDDHRHQRRRPSAGTQLRPGASARARPPRSASLLTAWALSVDFVKASGGGFFGDAATYYTLGHSLAHDLDFEYQRDDLARVWEEFPSGPEGPLPQARPRRTQLFFAKAYIYPLLAAPFIWLFGTNGFLVLHALLMTLCFACAYAFLAARSHPVAALIFAFAFLFVSLVPIYMVQLGPDFFIFAIVLFGYFFWCYKEVGGPAPEDGAAVVAHALAAGAALGHGGRRAARRQRRSPSRPTSA